MKDESSGTKKICVIGNSQIAALKTYQSGLEQTDMSLDYFGADNSAYIRESAVFDPKTKYLNAQGPTLEKHWITSGGADHIDLSTYDAFVLFGFDLFEFRNRFLVEYLDSPLSAACRLQQLNDMLAQHPGHAILSELGKYKHGKPVWMSNGPLFTATHGYLLNYSRTRDTAEARRFLDGFWSAHCKKMGAVYVTQPEKTIDVNGISSKQSYMKVDKAHLAQPGAKEFFEKLITLIGNS